MKSSKALLIIVGIILAVIITLSGSLYKDDQVHQQQAIENSVNPLHETQNQQQTSEVEKYHSAARLMHIFVQNLPFLNKK